MAVRIATFNAENLMHRFDFSGYRNETRRDRAIQVLDVKDEDQYKALEQSRVIAHTDDDMQLTALAIADTQADIVCLQEVENLDALRAFEYGYLYKMIGWGYRHKYLIEGNDPRGIDVAVMTRDETADGQKIEVTNINSNAGLTYGETGLYNDDLRELGLEATDFVFRRDCFEVDLKVGEQKLTLFVVHFKSMGSNGDNGNGDGRTRTMPIRIAEAKATRQIIEDKFGRGKTGNKRWLICGDLNDYRSRVIIDGTRQSGYSFDPKVEKNCGHDVLLKEEFSFNLAERRPVEEQWTLYHSRGPEEQHLCQLDYLLASPHIAETNPKAIPDIIHSGQPYRTVFPEGQEVERYPRTGWDRPKASDHSPVVVTLNLV